MSKKPQPKHGGQYSKSHVSEQANDERSVMQRPEYVPPKDEPPRGAGSLAYKKIPSKGLR